MVQSDTSLNPFQSRQLSKPNVRFLFSISWDSNYLVNMAERLAKEPDIFPTGADGEKQNRSERRVNMTPNES